MATDRSGSVISGLLVPDPRIVAGAISTTLSSGLTQAGPRPGTPEPYTDGQDSDLVLQALGEQTATTSYRVTVARAGIPGLDEAGVHWYDDSSSPSVGPYGWEPPVTISGWEALQYVTTSTFSEPHAIRLASGNVLLTYLDSAASAIRARTYDASTSTWGSAVTVVSTTGLGSGTKSPTVCQLDDGRILLAHWIYTSTEAQVIVRVSEDGGATWAVWSEYGLQYSLTLAVQTPGRLRIAHSAGQVLLVASTRWSTGTYEDRWVQWASSDLGCRFDYVETSDGSTSVESCAQPDVVVVDGVFVVAYLEVDGASSAPCPCVRRIGDPYQALSGVEAVSLGGVEGAHDGTGKQVQEGDLAIVLDEDGCLWLYSRDYANSERGAVNRSVDGGENWTSVSSVASVYGWHRADDTSTHPKDFCAVAQGGRVMLPHSFSASPDTHDNSPCVLYLGGYSTLTLPARAAFPSPAERLAWQHTWLPYDLPEDTAAHWALATSGGATAPALTSGKLVMTTAGLQTITYTTASAPTGTVAEGIIFEGEVEVTSGTAVVEVRIGDGSDAYEVQINVTGTSIVLLDAVAPATIATATTATAATGVRLRVAIAGTDASAWYAPSGRSPSRAWTQIGSTTSLATTGMAGTHRIRFRQDQGTTAKWTFIAYSSDQYTGQQLATGQTSSTLFPRSLTGGAISIGPTGLLRIRGVDGPGRVGEAWSISTAYDYGVENLHHEVAPSPRRTWRSTGTASTCRIAWDVDADGAGNRGLLSPIAGLYLGGINFRQAVIAGRSGGAWTDLATLDAAAGLTGLYFARSGDTLRVDTGTAHTGDTYLPTNILAGSHVKLDDGAGNVVYKRMLGNTEGAWTSQVTKRPVIRIEDAATTDPASGTMEIWLKEAFVAWHQPVATYDAYRLTISSGSTAEGYFEAGTAVIGRVHVFGQRPDWGRVLSLTPASELFTARGGARRARRLGPARRAAEFSLMDAVDTSGIGGTDPVPDYLTGYSGSTAPVATVAGTPYDLMGLVEEVGGSLTPVVYLPSLARSASSSGTIQVANRELMLYGRIVSTSLRLETVHGEEWGGAGAGEVIRVPTVTVEEEV